MDKNIRRSIGKKLENAGKGKKDQEKLLKANVRMLMHKHEGVTPT